MHQTSNGPNCEIAVELTSPSSSSRAQLYVAEMDNDKRATSDEWRLPPGLLSSLDGQKVRRENAVYDAIDRALKRETRSQLQDRRLERLLRGPEK